MRRSWIALVVVLAGCSSGAPSEPPAARPALTGAQAHAGAPPTSGALTQIPDTEATRIRLGYVAVVALAQADLPVSARDVKRRVLGAGAAALPDSGVTSAVQVGADATVLRGDGPAWTASRAARTVSCSARTRSSWRTRHPRRARSRPRRRARCSRASATRWRRRSSGPRRWATTRRSASGSPRAATSPPGIQLRHLRRAEVHPPHPRDGEAARSARFGDLNAVIAEREIGEREIVSGVVAADGAAVAPGSAAARRRRELRALAWR